MKGHDFIMKENFGIQLYSLRDETKKDHLAVLEYVSKLGFPCIEFAGYYGMSAKEMKATLDRLNLKAVSTHVGPDRLRTGLLEEIAYNKAVGNNTIICPWYAAKTKEQALEAAKEMNEWANICAKEGMTFGYHNHDFEFLKVDGDKTVMDIILENTDDCFKMELDVYWAVYAGYDPIEFIEKYKNRMCMLHLKEIAADNKTNIEFGNGVIDWMKVVEAGRKAGVTHYILEQEEYSVPVLESIKICADNMNKIFGE